MKKKKRITMIILDILEERPLVKPMPHWMMFLLYLITLRAMNSPEVTVLRRLILAVTLLLITMILGTIGAPELVIDVIRHWPLLP